MSSKAVENMSLRFEEREPTIDSKESIFRLRQAFKSIANIIQGSTPESRERSLAITHLEIASMFANKAVVFNQDRETE